MRPLPIAFAAVMSLVLNVVPPASAEGCCRSAAYSLTPIEQATQADLVIVGKVCDLEPDLIKAEQYKGSGPVAYMVANIRIEEALLGGQGLTHVRVGYIPTIGPANMELGFLAPPQGQRIWQGNTNLVPGQEACFLLQKHPNGDFHVLLQYGNPLSKGELAYDAEMKAVRSVVKAFNEPLEALRAKDVRERQLAACALVMRYRTQRPSNVPVSVVNEPIAAEESKLILQALSAMKWGELPFDANGVFSLQNMFSYLNVTAANGWQQPPQKANENFNEVMGKAVSTWLNSHADTFHVQRVVVKPQSAQ